MARKKGLSMEEKKAALLNQIMKNESFYNYKEIEAFAKKVGINPQVVKDVLSLLVEGDRSVTCEKVGSLNLYWSLPSQRVNMMILEYESLSNMVETRNDILRINNERIESIEVMTDDIRKQKQQIISEKKEDLNKLSEEMRSLTVSDPQLIHDEILQLGRAKDLANLWTENIFTLRSYIKKNFGISEEIINTEFDIEPDLDILE